MRCLVRKPHPGTFLAEEQSQSRLIRKGDWASKETERKSSSRAASKRVKSFLETSSTTQGVISLSSGEAELYAAESSSGSSMWHPTAAGFERPVSLCRPSTRRLSRSMRHGETRLASLDIKALWCQLSEADTRSWNSRPSGVWNEANKLHAPRTLVTLCRIS